jgi:VanZ family protein
MAITTKNITTLDDILVQNNYLSKVEIAISKHASNIHKINGLAYLSLVALPFTQTLSGNFFVPDYAAHMLAFAGLSATTERALATSKSESLKRNSSNVAYLTSYAIGLAFELYQGFVPNRSVSFYDELMNIGGAFIGANALKGYEFKTNLSKVRKSIARELLFNHPRYSRDITNGIVETKTSF